MKVSISHPSEPALSGFKFFWAKTVTGFNPAKHCLVSLLGPRHKVFKPSMPVGSYSVPAVSEEEVYICGVSDPPGGGWNTLALNFHLVMRVDREAPVYETRTYNGYTVRIEGGVPVPISPLPQGWNGLDTAFTRCRNFQYGVQRFGYATRLLNRSH